jgi:hypothetical protein
MAILRIGSFGKSYTVPASFENEQELERVLAENLQLLVADGAPPPVLLTQQLILPDAGTLDLLLLDVESIPIVVETKLAKSGDCRREVVAQAIDCVSALAQLTVAQLDAAAGGAVERALRTFAGDDGNDFDRRWTALAVNLRAARVRFIVAVDEVRPSLARIIRFLAEHSNLDVRCVAVAKSREPDGDTYYAPTIVLDAVRTSPQPLAASKVTPPELPAVLDSVDWVPPPKGIRLVGSAANYRKTVAPAWRASAHDEFVKRAGVGAEAHPDDAGAAAGSVGVARIAETPPFDLARVQWDG